MSSVACRYVRRLIGQRVQLRLTPEIRFVYDVAVDRSEKVLALLEQVEADRLAAENPQGTAVAAEVQPAVGVAVGGDIGADNPFLEGVGDSRYDSDYDNEQPSRFFTADMFPDARPEIDELQARKKAEMWKEGRTRKARYRSKSSARRK